MSSGVPQGFFTAPLLFNLYVNDITFTKSRMLLFTDDIKLFNIIRTLNDAELLQNYRINIYIVIESDYNLILCLKCKNIINFRKKKNELPVKRC